MIKGQKMLKAPGRDIPMPPRLYLDTETAPIGKDGKKEEHIFRCGTGIYVEENVNLRLMGQIPPIKKEFSWKSIEQVWMDIRSLASVLKGHRPKTGKMKGKPRFRYGGTSCDLVVMAHNMDYDQLALHADGRGDFMPDGFRLDLEKSFISLNGMNGPYLITYETKENAVVVFADTTNYYRVSTVEQLGKSFGTPKLDMLANQTDADWFTYCRQDTFIIYTAMEGFIQFFWNESGLINPGVSTSQASDRLYRTKFMPRDSIWPHPIEAEYLSSHGGATESFYSGIPSDDWGKLFKMDRNSMYPAEAIGRIPTILSKLSSYGKNQVERGLMEEDLIWLVHANVSIPYLRECLPSIQEGRLLFPCGDFSGWFWDVELKLLTELGGDYEIIEGYGYHAKAVFTKYMEHMYEVKEKASTDGDEVIRLMAKLYLNSILGKMNTRRKPKPIEATNEDFIWWMDDKEFSGHEQVSTREPVTYDFLESTGIDLDELPDGFTEPTVMTYWKFIDGKLYKIPDINDIQFYIGETRGKVKSKVYGANAHPGIYGYNTACARVNLWKAIHGLRDAGFPVFYADTDSVITDVGGRDWMEGQGMLGQALGEWKEEETSEPFACDFRSPKNYNFDNKQVIKGRQKTSVRPMDKVGELLPRPNRFRGDMLRGRNKRLVWNAVSYLATNVNNKRVVDGDGWTSPITLGETK